MRLLLVLFIALTLIAPVSADPQYDDIKAAFQAVSAAVDTLAHDVDQAGDAAAVALAFTKFGDAMREFKKTKDDLQKLHPELADQKEPPAELQDALVSMQASFGQFPAIMKKANPYITDPIVQDAVQKMKESW